MQGRLHQVVITAHVHRDSQLELRAAAKYHGKHTRRVELSWHHRHVELARAMIKETLHEFSQRLREQWRVPAAPLSTTWRDAMYIDHEQTDTETMTSLSELSCDIDQMTLPVPCGTARIEAQVVNVEWSNEFRWGGDDMYDPNVDGDIWVEAMCVMRDDRPRPPVWMLRTDQHAPSIFHDLGELHLSINDWSSSVVVTPFTAHVEPTKQDPWYLGGVCCSVVQVSL